MHVIWTCSALRNGLFLCWCRPQVCRRTHCFDPVKILTIASLLISISILQSDMFHGASLFNQDLSNWDVSSGQDFVSACYLDLMSVEPSHMQEDPRLWPWHTLTRLPLLLFSSTLRVTCFGLHHSSTKICLSGMSLNARRSILEDGYEDDIHGNEVVKIADATE